jgi:hypothetical protein
MYKLTHLEGCDGPEIDWNRYEITFREMTTGFRQANKRLLVLILIVQSPHFLFRVNRESLPLKLL